MFRSKIVLEKNVLLCESYQLMKPHLVRPTCCFLCYVYSQMNAKMKRKIGGECHSVANRSVNSVLNVMGSSLDLKQLNFIKTFFSNH